GKREGNEANWRGVFLVYGTLGLLAAVAFWFVARDAPENHPWANQAEAARVPPAPAAPAIVTPWLLRLGALAASPNMWLFGATQFFINVGWAFLITNLPTFLKDRFEVHLDDVGRMQTVPLVASCVGMAVGGLFADLMYHRLGPRWGRAVPIGVVMFLCAITYLAATQLSSAWAVIGALTLMAFLVDLAVPSIWAFAQDVGGRQVGAALRVGHLPGNFGAAASPVVLHLIRREFGWDMAFAACAACFVVAGACGLSLNALIPVTRDEPDAEAEDYRES